MDALPTKKPEIIDFSGWDVSKYNYYKVEIESLTGSSPVLLDFGEIEYLDPPVITLIKDLVVRVYPVNTIHIKDYQNIEVQLKAVGVFPFFMKK